MIFICIIYIYLILFLQSEKFQFLFLLLINDWLANNYLPSSSKRDNHISQRLAANFHPSFLQKGSWISPSTIGWTLDPVTPCAILHPSPLLYFHCLLISSSFKATAENKTTFVEHLSRMEKINLSVQLAS